MTSLIGEGTGQNKTIGAIDQEIDRLKEYKAFLQKGFKKFTTDGANAMLAVGIQSGQSKGIKTANGILFLSKSSKEIKPNPDEVIAKYKIYRIKEFDITDTKLNKILISYSGKRFIEFLNALKIDKACEMLLTTDKSVIDISFELGFNTVKTFNNNFLKLKNMSPTDFRKTVKHSS